MCPLCLVIKISCYYDHRINKTLTGFRSLLCVFMLCSRDLIELLAQRIMGFFKSKLPTREREQQKPDHIGETRHLKTQFLQPKTKPNFTRSNSFFDPLCLIPYAVVIDGGWSLWSNWSSCSGICGKLGNKTRSRNCTNPAPKNGGEKCQGSKESVAQCIVPCTYLLSQADNYPR